MDIDKLKTCPADLSEISNVVDNNVLKKLCMKNKSLRLMHLMLVDLFWKLNLMRVDNADKKICDTSGVAERQIKMLRFLRLTVKYLVLLV